MKQHKIEGKVYMVGEPGLKTELELEGYQVSGLEHSDIKGLPHVPDIDMETKAVVCGLDRYSHDGVRAGLSSHGTHMVLYSIGTSLTTRWRTLRPVSARSLVATSLAPTREFAFIFP
ncbi:unnamed protein product [Phytophthora lilii]|uniref:Unnamed protein product n=1 Tax=Phytophthora lilii TaxID=2077276 RepID=A0A9W6WU48_9STRA|nr:unnamed protein product [Phytophthora lilii]